MHWVVFAETWKNELGEDGFNGLKKVLGKILNVGFGKRWIWWRLWKDELGRVWRKMN